MARSIDYDRTVTFIGAVTSSAVDLGFDALLGLFVPDDMAGTLLTFSVCDTDDGTYFSIRNDENGAVSLVISDTGAYYPLDPASFVGVRHMKIVSNAAETAVIKLATRHVG